MGRQKIAPSLQMQLFNDPDLRKPEHDQIVEWTDQQLRSNPGLFAPFLLKPHYSPYSDEFWIKNANKEERWGYGPSYGERGTEGLIRNALMPIGQDLAGLKPSAPSPTVSKVVWEQPLRWSSNSSRQAGFVDLMAEFRCGSPYWQGLVETRDISPVWKPSGSDDWKRSEIARPGTGILGEAALILSEVSGAVLSKNGAVEILTMSKRLGEDDRRPDAKAWIERNERELAEAMGHGSAIDSRHHYLLTSNKWSIGEYELSLFIEAKTEVLSKGELIRQLRFYSEKGARPLVVVAPPVDGLEQLLREQGFGFVAYDPERSVTNF